jgi:hypothetical protein
MRLIAHRGLVSGVSKGHIENHPEQVNFALMLGYDAEIDVRYIEGMWFLGHDKPDYQVPYQFILQKNLWLHCKNLEALEELTQRCRDTTWPNFFWHQEDDYTITSHGHIWTHVKSKVVSPAAVTMVPDTTR